jgi:trans-aconitate 2-methyltransferase
MTTTDTWNPAQYDKFQREREQPFFDLLAMIAPAPGMRIVDLGCGTGKLTRELHQRLDARETLGLDRSARMLAAQDGATLPPGLSFRNETVEAFLDRGDCYDLVFSNAVYHWIEDHPALLEKLAARLAPGGQIAFQVPAMHGDPSHLVADALSDEEPYRSALGGWRRANTVLTPDEYSRQLFRLGFSAPRSCLMIYPHVLADRGAVVEWVKGTLLAEYEKRMPADMFARFVNDYRARLLPTFEDARPFFYPFKRILCWGKRSG